MNRARAVRFLDGHRIEVCLENGYRFVYDLSPKLNTMRFLELSDDALFRRGSLVDEDHIRWSDTLVLYVHEMLDAAGGTAAGGTTRGTQPEGRTLWHEPKCPSLWFLSGFCPPGFSSGFSPVSKRM